MHVWRIARRRYSALEGEGPRWYGGRWTPRGRPAVYTASSLPLATLEALVHFDSDVVPTDLVAHAIDVPDDLARETVAIDVLRDSWRSNDAVCLPFGAAWLDRGETLVLVVPSAVVPAHANLILNPRHPDMGRIVVTHTEPYALDPRLLKGKGKRADEP